MTAPKCEVCGREMVVSVSSLHTSAPFGKLFCPATPQEHEIAALKAELLNCKEISSKLVAQLTAARVAGEEG